MTEMTHCMSLSLSISPIHKFYNRTTCQNFGFQIGRRTSVGKDMETSATKPSVLVAMRYLVLIAALTAMGEKLYVLHAWLCSINTIASTSLKCALHLILP